VVGLIGSETRQRENAVGSVREKEKGARTGKQQVPYQAVLLNCASEKTLGLFHRLGDTPVSEQLNPQVNPT